MHAWVRARRRREMATLKDVSRVAEHLKLFPFRTVKILYRLVYEEEGDRSSRKRLREFAGFQFTDGSDEHRRKTEYIEKTFNDGELLSICAILGLDTVALARDATQAILGLLMNISRADEDEEEDDDDDEEEEEETVHSAVVADKRAPIKADRIRFSIRDFEESTPVFTGEGQPLVADWVATMEEMAVMFEWAPIEQFVYGKKFCGGTAREFLSAERGIASWATLKSRLNGEFGRTISSVEVHDQLRKAAIKDAEAYTQFVYRMQNVAKQCSHIEEEAVVEYIIRGLGGPEHKKAILYEAITITELKRKLRIYEKINRGPEKEISAKKEKVSTSARCYNCGGVGHMSADCRHKGKGTRCFKCNDFGHIAAKCNDRANEDEATLHVTDGEDDAVFQDVCVRGRRMRALLDTGSGPNLIRVSEATAITTEGFVDPGIKIRGIGENVVKTLGCFTVQVEGSGFARDTRFHVVRDKDMPVQVILGREFLKGLNFSILAGVVNVCNMSATNDVIPVGDVSDEESRLKADCLKIQLKDARGKETTEEDVSPAKCAVTMLCKEEESIQVLITTGQPRGNGQVERMNQIIIPILTKLTQDAPGDWYKHISRVQRCINATVQRAIGTSPFQLLTGVTFRDKGDEDLREIVSAELAEAFARRRDDMRDAAKVQILKIQEENRRQYNKKRKASESYRSGQLVAIKRTQFGPGLKCRNKFLGPYQIIICEGNDRYSVRKIGSGEGPAQTMTSADFMKLWRRTDDEGSSGDE